MHPKPQALAEKENCGLKSGLALKEMKAMIKQYKYCHFQFLESKAASVNNISFFPFLG